jgi:hypothetical protein
VPIVWLALHQPKFELAFIRGKGAPNFINMFCNNTCASRLGMRDVSLAAYGLKKSRSSKPRHIPEDQGNDY